MDTYEVDVAGIKHTMQLDAEDAKRYGNRAKKVTVKGAPATKQAAAPANKSATPTASKDAADADAAKSDA